MHDAEVISPKESFSGFGFLPNVKDEPRPSLARRVQHDGSQSGASFPEFVREHAA
jgi:hypothetical protein